MDSEKRLRHELAELNLLLRGLAQIPAFPAELLELISGKVESISRLVNYSDSEESFSNEESIIESEPFYTEPENPVLDPLDQLRLIDLTKTLTLNDRFRFQREFFGNDPQKMSETFSVINKSQTVDDALAYLREVCVLDETSDSFQDFRLMLNLHFSGESKSSQAN